jgi:hypothetical protein
MYIIMDGLDELAVFRDNRELLRFTDSFLDYVFLSQINTIAYIPYSLSSVSKEKQEIARCGKIPCIDMKWRYEMLIEVLRRWWAYDSQGQSSISDFFGRDPLTIGFIKKAMDNGVDMCTPRKILLVCQQAAEILVRDYFKLPETERGSYKWSVNSQQFKKLLQERDCLPPDSIFDTLSSMLSKDEL